MKELVLGKITISTLLITGAFAIPSLADYSLSAVVTSIEIMRDEGVLIRGSFGNPHNPAWQEGNTIFVSATHPGYDQIYSAAITSMTTKVKVKGYSHQCRNLGWYGHTFPEVIASGVICLSP